MAGTLRENLINALPHMMKVFEFIDSLINESPRGAVLISAGYLEEILREMLAAAMLPGKITDELLTGGNAPLGTFSARIAASYSLSLIDRDQHHDLTLIRRIRNEFAHGMETSFETAKIKSWCNELRLETMGRQIKSTRDQFEAVALGLIQTLATRPDEIAKRRREFEEWNP